MSITQNQLDKAVKGWNHPALAILEAPIIDYLDVRPRRHQTMSATIKRTVTDRDEHGWPTRYTSTPVHQIERLQFYRWLIQHGHYHDEVD